MELRDMKVSDLRKQAADRNIAGRGEMNKGELVAALEQPTLEERIARLEERVYNIERGSVMADEKQSKEDVQPGRKADDPDQAPQDPHGGAQGSDGTEESVGAGPSGGAPEDGSQGSQSTPAEAVGDGPSGGAPA